MPPSRPIGRTTAPCCSTATTVSTSSIGPTATGEISDRTLSRLPPAGRHFNGGFPPPPSIDIETVSLECSQDGCRQIGMVGAWWDLLDHSELPGDPGCTLERHGIH